MNTLIITIVAQTQPKRQEQSTTITKNLGTFVNFNSKNHYFQRISAWWGVVISAVTLFWSEMPDWDTDAEVQILFFATMAPKSRLARGTEVPWWRKRMLIKSYEITRNTALKANHFWSEATNMVPESHFFGGHRKFDENWEIFLRSMRQFLEMEWLVFGSFPTFSSLAIIPWMGLENPGNLPDHNWDRGIWLAARRSVAASTPLHIIGIKFIPRLKEWTQSSWGQSTISVYCNYIII